MTEEEARTFIELHVRRLLADEVRTHREFLESNLRRTLAAITVVATLGTGLLLYFLGRDYNNTRKLISEEISASVMRYRIDEQLRNEISTITSDIVDGEGFRSHLNELVEEKSNQIVPQKVDLAIAEKLESESDALRKENVEDFLQRAADARFGALGDEISIEPAESVRLTNNRVKLDTRKVTSEKIEADLCLLTELIHYGGASHVCSISGDPQNGWVLVNSARNMNVTCTMSCYNLAITLLESDS